MRVVTSENELEYMQNLAFIRLATDILADAGVEWRQRIEMQNDDEDFNKLRKWFRYKSKDEKKLGMCELCCAIVGKDPLHLLRCLERIKEKKEKKRNEVLES